MFGNFKAILYYTYFFLLELIADPVHQNETGHLESYIELPWMLVHFFLIFVSILDNMIM